MARKFRSYEEYMRFLDDMQKMKVLVTVSRRMTEGKPASGTVQDTQSENLSDNLEKQILLER